MLERSVVVEIVQADASALHVDIIERAVEAYIRKLSYLDVVYPITEFQGWFLSI